MSQESPTAMTLSHTTKLPIVGMSCQHCVHTVEEALKAIDGVEQATVSLKPAHAAIVHRSDVPQAQLVDAIERVGFDVG